jgi:hypothetical protein
LKILSFKDKRIKIVDYVEAEPVELLRVVREQKLEGIVGKRKDSLYEPGRRTGAWIKRRVSRGQGSSSSVIFLVRMGSIPSSSATTTLID